MARLQDFLAWVSARGVSGPALAVYEAGAERLLSAAGAGPLLPAQVESVATAAAAAGAAPHGVNNLRKIGAALLVFQRERTERSRPRLVYCGNCKMSHDPAKNSAGCPYCRTPGFVRRMRHAQEEERRALERKAAIRDAANHLASEMAGAALLFAELPDLEEP